MKSIVSAIVAASLIVGVGVYHGFATDRWADPAASDHPGRKLTEIPLAIGEWTGEVLPRSAEDDPKTSVEHRKFTNARTGKWIMTAVTTGKPGYVSVHNPEHCYLGSGYRVVDSIQPMSMKLGETKEARFWTGHFEKKKATNVESIRIYWGWTTNGDWQAPNYPRFHFAGRNTLHKLYFIHAVNGHETPEEISVYEDFMRQYLQQINQRIAH
jgi:hypothetical protein